MLWWWKSSSPSKKVPNSHTHRPQCHGLSLNTDDPQHTAVSTRSTISVVPLITHVHSVEKTPKLISLKSLDTKEGYTCTYVYASNEMKTFVNHNTRNVLYFLSWVQWTVQTFQLPSINLLMTKQLRVIWNSIQPNPTNL